MRRPITAAVASLGLILALASCGQHVTRSSAPQPPAYPDRVVGTLVEKQTDAMLVDGPMVLVVRTDRGSTMQLVLPGPMQPDPKVRALYDIAGTMNPGDRIEGQGTRSTDASLDVRTLTKLN